MSREHDFKRFTNLQQKYGVLLDVNMDLNEKFTKLQEKYDELFNEIKLDLKFLELNWLKDTPIIEGLKKKYKDFSR